VIQFLGSLSAIVLVDLALSGDNALVIGAAASGLSRRRRLLAILAGGGSAIVLRVAFAAAATLLLLLPLIEAIGGVVLLIIAARLLMGRNAEEATHEEAAAEGVVAKEPSFGQALLTILVADVTMSLDNILAVGGLARGDLKLLAIGLFISIALLMVGSAIVAELIGRLPVLLDLAALTLGWTGASMALHDHIVGSYLGVVPYAGYVVPAIGALIVLMVDVLLRIIAARRRRDTLPVAASSDSSETTSVR
jgi:YjbE family integral membrane protein